MIQITMSRQKRRLLKTSMLQLRITDSNYGIKAQNSLHPMVTTVGNHRHPVCKYQLADFCVHISSGIIKNIQAYEKETDRQTLSLLNF